MHVRKTNMYLNEFQKRFPFIASRYATVKRRCSPVDVFSDPRFSRLDRLIETFEPMRPRIMPPPPPPHRYYFPHIPVHKH